MAWPKISVGGTRPWFLTLCDEKIVDDCSFSFYLTSASSGKSSALVLGGIDSKYYKGDFNYINITGEDYWRIAPSALVIGKKNYTVGNSIVDSGTSLMVCPTAVYKDLGFSKTIDCNKTDTLPTMTFTIGGKDYSLTGKDYVLNIEGECLVGV